MKPIHTLRLALLAAAFGFTLSVRALTIIPTFDSSITNNANVATIEATTNTAIQLFETRFSNNATVTIQYKTINAAGDYGQSSWWYYSIPYTYTNHS